MFGVLNINKPSGVTSRDVVNQVQHLVRPVKLGHAGTLDPLATGVLVVCLGPATRLVEYVQRMPKRYRGTFQLGKQSDTEDIDGQVTEISDAPQPERAEIEHALAQFIGEIQQRPPAYSALKIKGKRAYALARKGEQVKLEQRTITVHDIQLIEYQYPQLRLDIQCGSGTYVRSLGRDIAESLGTSAVMSALVRTAIGDQVFPVERAVELPLNSNAIRENLMPALCAVDSLPKISLTPAEFMEIGHGRAIEDRFDEKGEELVVVDCEQQLAAVLVRRGQQLRPLKNFCAVS